MHSGGLCEHNSSVTTPGFPTPSPRASAAGRRTLLCSQPVKSRCWSCCGLLPARLADLILSSPGTGTTTVCKQGCKKTKAQGGKGQLQSHSGSVRMDAALVQPCSRRPCHADTPGALTAGNPSIVSVSLLSHGVLQTPPCSCQALKITYRRPGLKIWSA